MGEFEEVSLEPEGEMEVKVVTPLAAQFADASKDLAAIGDRVRALQERVGKLASAGERPLTQSDKLPMASRGGAENTGAGVEYEQAETLGSRARIMSAARDKLIELSATDPAVRRVTLYTYRLYVTPTGLLGRLMLLYTR